MPTVILDLQALSSIPTEQINTAITRLIAQAAPGSPSLGFVTIDQLTAALIDSKLTLAATGTLSLPVSGAGLNPDDELTFNIAEANRSGFITGTQIIATVGVGNQINADVVSYSSVTGDLVVTVVEGVGATETDTWTVAYAAAVTTAATVSYAAAAGYPGTVLTVQDALDYVSDKIQASQRQYSVVAPPGGQSAFTPTGGYNPYGLMVFVNGEYVRPANYVATDGVTITLNTGAIPEGDNFSSISFQPYELADPVDAATLNTQAPSFYLNLANATGNLANARLPARLQELHAASTELDYNNMLASGDYYMPTNSTNLPLAATAAWLEVKAGPTNDDVLQIAHLNVANPATTPITPRWMRRKTGGTWSAWVRDNPELLWVWNVAQSRWEAKNAAGTQVIARLTNAGALTVRDDLVAFDTSI